MSSATDDISLGPSRAPEVTVFDDFYRRHVESIVHALEITLGNPELAEDAANEGMARALQRWKRVAHYDNPAGWVYRVAMNWAMSWMRRRRRETDRPLPLAAASEVSLHDHDLRDAVDRLSIDHRSVVVCRYFLDWSVAQTAAALDIPAGTVKSRLARALDNIRADLEGTGT